MAALCTVNKIYSRSEEGKNTYIRFGGQKEKKVCPSEAPAPVLSDVINTAVRPAVNLRGGGDEEEVVNV